VYSRAEWKTIQSLHRVIKRSKQSSLQWRNGREGRVPRKERTNGEREKQILGLHSKGCREKRIHPLGGERWNADGELDLGDSQKPSASEGM